MEPGRLSPYRRRAGQRSAHRSLVTAARLRHYRQSVLPTLAAVVVLATAAAPFPGAKTSSICGAKSIPFQQSALTSASGSLWLACRDSGRLVQLSTQGVTQKTVKLGRFYPWAVAAGSGAVWTISRDVPELWKFNPTSGRRVAWIALPGTPASLWFGAGSAWVGFDGVGFARVNGTTGKVTPFFTGNGVSAFAGDGSRVFAVSHRDNAITRVDLPTGSASIVAAGIADTSRSATEEVVFASGSLWITGRGLDLLRVDRRTGRVEKTIQIGPAGVKLAVSRGRLIVASYTKAGAMRGDPIVGRFGVFDPTRSQFVASTAATQTVYLSGLSVVGGTTFVADTVSGRLVRLPLLSPP